MFCQKCGTQNPDDGRFCRSCGKDLGNTAVAPVPMAQPNIYYDHRGRARSNDPSDIWSNAVRNMLMGAGFFVISMALLISNVANGQRWWWAMLFPAFTFLATGVSQAAKVKRLDRERAAQAMPGQTMHGHMPSAPHNASLPPTANEYIPQQPRSIYDTGEFEMRPPSVTEGTTRHLEINKEGETMTLPKKD